MTDQQRGRHFLLRGRFCRMLGCRRACAAAAAGDRAVERSRPASSPAAAGAGRHRHAIPTSNIPPQVGDRAARRRGRDDRPKLRGSSRAAADAESWRRRQQPSRCRAGAEAAAQEAQDFRRRPGRDAEGHRGASSASTKPANRYIRAASSPRPPDFPPWKSSTRSRRLPPYVFEQVNRLKASARAARRRHHRSRHGQSRPADAASTSSTSWSRPCSDPRTHRYSSSQGHSAACAAPRPAITSAASA